jgi:CO/xanthine dehydrogenase Mo-binding subunit
VGFAKVEVDRETGHIQIVDYTGIPRSASSRTPCLAAQVTEARFQGSGLAMSQKWVYDPTGASPTQRLYTAKLPIL